MSDDDLDLPLSLPLVAYRLAQAEIVLKAMQVELHDLRQEREGFVRRVDVERAAKARREWPLILGGLAVALCSIASVVIQVAHG